jgi:hypothetical protein
MSYESPKGPMKSDERILVPTIPLVEGEENTTLELMKQFPGVAAYGMLLLDDAKHPMAELVHERWSEISNMTGNIFVLFTFERPADWTKSYMQYWRNKLGDNFEPTWKKWQDAPEPGAAYAYTSLFKPALTPNQLPCLALFTDAEERRAVVRPIPKWDKESLFDLLKGIATVVQQSAKIDDPDKRLDWLRHELTSPSALFVSSAGHAGSRAMDYFKQHPARVASTVISVVLGLSSGGMFTLPKVATSALNVLKDTIPGGT